MMKKKYGILAVISAVLMLVGCSDNKNISSEPIGDVTEAVTTEAKSEYKVYSESDFTDVNVTLSRINSDPPVNITDYDTSWIDCGKRTPICLTEEYRDLSYEYFVSRNGVGYFSTVELPSHETEMREIFAKYCSCKSGGIVNCIEVYGEKLFAVVDFDVLHYTNGSHDMALYEFDLANKTKKEWFSHCSPDVKMSVMSLNIVDGEPMLRIITAEDDHASPLDDRITHVNEEEKVLLIHADGSTEEINEGWVKDEYSTVIAYHGKELNIVRNHDRTHSISCTDFAINTDLKSIVLRAATDSSIIVSSETAMKKTLYTYNLAKMERYIMDGSIANSGRFYPLGDIVCIDMYDGSYSIFIPELGAYYYCEDDHSDYTGSEHNLICSFDGKVWMIVTDTSVSYDGDGYWTTDKLIDNIKVFSAKETS